LLVKKEIIMSRASDKKEDLKFRRLLKPDSKFQFSCHKGVECFNSCCRKVDIFLTPYDILRMKNRLELSSEEFLREYTGNIIGSSGLPVIFLKMRDDEERNCPFVSESGCEIYEDRPWPCRAFPLKPESSKKTDAAGKEFYSLVNEPKCLGYNEDKEWTVKEWKEDQGMDIYNEMEALFKEITQNESIVGDEILNENVRRMFYVGCYDLDRFKRFVFESRFLDVFDVDEKEIEKIKKDELELLKFALKWTKFGFVDQTALKIKDSVLKAKEDESK
jgi:Fe-S-cluster containining protein